MKEWCSDSMTGKWQALKEADRILKEYTGCSSVFYKCGNMTNLTGMILIGGGKCECQYRKCFALILFNFHLAIKIEDK
jgi:hypothetical protein